MSSSEVTVTRRRWFQPKPTFFPVLHRELREGSHRAFNYYIRLVAGVFGMGLLWVCVREAENEMNTPSVGMFLFAALHTFLLVLIVTIVPIMTADCIASEKRNGTLGLLFLTPLTARGIMIGKSGAHAFRAFTLWLSVAPVLIIPFLMGGIGWFDITTALTMQFCALVVSLAAGLLASALFQKRNVVYFAASAFGVGLNSALALFVAVLCMMRMAPGSTGTVWNWLSRGMFLEMLLFLITGFAGFWGGMSGAFGGWGAVLRSPGLASLWKTLLIASVLTAFLLLFIAVTLGAWQIKRTWREKISRGPTKWGVRLCTPIFLKRFKAQMQHLLDKNPIAWLQQYSWRARSTKWGLCLGFILIETFVVSVTQNFGNVLDAMTALQVLLVIIASLMFVFVGVSSFQSEKQTGALELILITPLRVKQIIFGRVYGLWKQFLPSYLVIAGSHIATVIMFVPRWSWYNGTTRYGTFDSEDALIYVAITMGFLNLPVFATYFALRVKNMVAAGILTAITVYLAPVFGVLVFIGGIQMIARVNVTSSNIWIAVGFVLGNVFFAAIVVFLLHHSLSRRIYSF